MRNILSKIHGRDLSEQRLKSASSGRSLSDLVAENLQLRNENIQLQYELKTATDRTVELEKLLGIHQVKIIDLEKEKKRRKGKPFGPNTPSSKENFKENADDQNKRRQGGAKQGHKGSGRKPFKDDEIDRTEVKTLPSVCSCCQGTQFLSLGDSQRDVLDLSLDQIEKIRYRFAQGECLVCGMEVKQEVSALPRSMFGNGLLAKIAADHYVSGISLGTILGQLHIGDKIGGITSALHRLASIAESAYDKIVEDYRNSPVRHADETGWRTDGQNGYTWGFFSQSASIFVVGVTRAAATVKRILGEAALAGVLVVDRYSGYNQAPCQLQYCYAHLDRDVIDDREEFDTEESVVTFTTQLSNLLKEAMILRSKNIDDKTYLAEALRIKSEIVSLCKQGPPFEHSAIKYWRDFFNENHNRLFAWTTSRLIPCENNTAEREIRRLVLARKVSYGSQSAKGAKTREIIMTLLHTARKRLGPKADVAVWFKDALDAYSRGDIVNLYDALPTIKN